MPLESLQPEEVQCPPTSSAAAHFSLYRLSPPTLPPPHRRPRQLRLPRQLLPRPTTPIKPNANLPWLFLVSKNISKPCRFLNLSPGKIPTTPTFSSVGAPVLSIIRPPFPIPTPPKPSAFTLASFSSAPRNSATKAPFSPIFSTSSPKTAPSVSLPPATPTPPCAPVKQLSPKTTTTKPSSITPAPSNWTPKNITPRFSSAILTSPKRIFQTLSSGTTAPSRSTPTSKPLTATKPTFTSNPAKWKKPALVQFKLSSPIPILKSPGAPSTIGPLPISFSSIGPTSTRLPLPIKTARPPSP